MSSEQLRPLRAEDAAAVAAVFHRAFGESRELDAEEIRSWLRNEELKKEWLRVAEVDGEVVGYGDLMAEGDELGADIAAPGYEDVFLEWAERTAREEKVGRVRAVSPPDHPLAKVLESRGYRLWRSSYRMETDLDEIAEPVIPAGVDLRSYRVDEDEDVLRTTLNDVFKNDPMHHEISPTAFHEHKVKARGFDSELWVLAWAGDELAGFAMSYPNAEGNPEIGWVSELGVRAPYRKKGLGEGLLLESFGRLKQRGLPRVRLGVDTENVAGALRLYERVGMEPVLQFDNWVLEL